MHTIKLNVQDNIYRHIMFLLKSLSSKELEIIEDNNVNKEIKSKRRLNAVSIHTNDFKFNREEANARYSYNW